MAWQFDTAHSSITFSAKHMMITTVHGRFNQWTGTITLDEQHPENSQVEVTIYANSLDTDNDQRDQHLKSPDFLDAQKYPTIKFKSTRVTELSDTTATILGQLTIHGQTREVSLSATLEGVTRNMQGVRVAGFTVDGTLNRKDWGLNWNVALEAGGWLVSDAVKVHVEAEVIQQAAPQEQQAQPAGAAQS